MKIAVYGATGQIGSRIVAEAQERGHEVTALSRRAANPDHRADAADADTARRVAQDHDAVVSAIAPSPDGPSGIVATYESLADSVGTTRLVVVGGAGSLFAAPGQRLVDSPSFPEAYLATALAHADVLDLLRAGRADLNWTYLSPAPEIQPGMRTGTYLVGADEPAGELVSIEDFAVALVDELEQPRHERSRVHRGQRRLRRAERREGRLRAP
jgi:putative NADH-flavin reductase